MDETSQKQAEVMGQDGLARITPMLQNKIDLLLHFLRNSRKPVGLIGSQEDQLTVFNILQKEEHFLHSAYTIQSTQEASLPSVFGLLFHLLSISEHEVSGADPEQLLTRHLAVLEKNSQILLLFICSANELDLESHALLMGLAERHPALRLIFAFSGQESALVEGRDFHLLMLPKQENGAFKQSGKPLSQLELKKFKLGVILVALLIAILLTMVGFLPEMGEQTRVEKSSQVEQESVGEIEGVKVSEPPVLVPKELLKPQNLLDEGNSVAPVFPAQKESVKVTTELQKESPVQSVKELKPFDAARTDEVEDEINEEQRELLALQKEEEKKPSPADLTAQDKERVSVASSTIVPFKSEKAVVKDKKPVEVVHQEKWLLSQPKGKFTLQIMGGRDQLSIANYAKAQKNREPFAYYRTVKKGESWYPLLYGIYPSKESAKEAINKLPQTLQKLKPWARSLESIQLEIHKAAGKDTPN